MSGDNVIPFPLDRVRPPEIGLSVPRQAAVQFRQAMTVLAAQLDRNTRTIERMTLAATGMTVGLYLWRRSLELNYPNWP